MPRLQVKSFATPDELHELPRLRVASVGLGDTAVGYCSFQPGWRWSADVGPLLGLSSCPTRHVGYCVSGTMHVVAADGQELDIPPHTVFEIPPGHEKWVVGDQPWVAVEWGGSSRAAQAAINETDSRALGTVVFTDIVASTARARTLGDTAWQQALAAHNARLREALNVHRGREVKTTGDGFLAVFDSPTRAVRCAAEMLRAVRALDLEIRVGMHTGEIEQAGDDVCGIAVNTASRVQELAQPGEVLLSATTRALLEGGGFQLAEAGTHDVKGLSEPQRLFRLVLSGAGSEQTRAAG